MDMQKPSVTKTHLAGVLYCSQATDEMSSVQLRQIIKTSQRNNSRRGITGMLAYGGGMFVQWLEGPPYEVRKLMATLASDARHETIVRLQKLTSLRARLYPSWSMQHVAPCAVRDAMFGCFKLTRNTDDQKLILQMIDLLEKDRSQGNRRQTNTAPPKNLGLIADNVGLFVKALFSTKRRQFEMSGLPTRF